MVNSDVNIAGINLKLGQWIDNVTETIAVKFQEITITLGMST